MENNRKSNFNFESRSYRKLDEKLGVDMKLLARIIDKKIALAIMEYVDSYGYEIKRYALRQVLNDLQNPERQAGIIERVPFEIDESDEISVREPVLHMNSIDYVKSNQKCLFMEDDDFDSIDTDLNSLVNIIEHSDLDIRAIVVNNNALQVIINNEYNFA